MNQPETSGLNHRIVTVAMGMMAACGVEIPLYEGRQVADALQNDIDAQVSGVLDAGFQPVDIPTSHTPASCKVELFSKPGQIYPMDCSGGIAEAKKFDPCTLDAAKEHKALLDHAARILADVDCLFSEGPVTMYDSGLSIVVKSVDPEKTWRILWYKPVMVGLGTTLEGVLVEKKLIVNGGEAWINWPLQFWTRKSAAGEVAEVTVGTSLEGEGICKDDSVMHRIGKSISVSWANNSTGTLADMFILTGKSGRTSDSEIAKEQCVISDLTKVAECQGQKELKSRVVCDTMDNPVVKQFPHFNHQTLVSIPQDIGKATMQQLASAMYALRKKQGVKFPGE